MRVASEEASAARDRDLAGLAALEARLIAAQAAPDDATPDEGEYPRRIDALVAAARATEVEARLAVRTGEERAAALAARVGQIEQAAVAEREARQRAVSLAQRRAREALVAVGIAKVTSLALVAARTILAGRQRQPTARPPRSSARSPKVSCWRSARAPASSVRSWRP